MAPRRNPPYLISPCHLAGPDATATGSLVMWLLADGWQIGSHEHAIVFSRREEGGLLEALQVRNRTSPVQSTCPASWSWEFTARRAPGVAAAWKVRFAPATPPELIATLATALTDPAQELSDQGRPHYLSAPLPHEAATRPLDAAGWMRDLAQDECVWYGPDQQTVVVTPLPPSICGNVGTNWLLAARRAIDDTALWYATAHPLTPTHLIRALCTRLADPAPVPRQACPGPEVGNFTVIRP
ncbi:DUF317 domain-containing protein [Streptomyces sp. SCSIO 30461]|uniref:DUF317 domain-containing protein n=1 Tax=Streptomyces sp. SCSIO 30461 TaxID=3118085 RepID=UPI0030D2EF0B